MQAFDKCRKQFIKREQHLDPISEQHPYTTFYLERTCSKATVHRLKLLARFPPEIPTMTHLRPLSAALFLFTLASAQNPSFTAMRTDWDDVAWAGLHSTYELIWKNIQFSTLCDYLFRETLVSYTSPTPTTKNLTFPSGAWMHIVHIETSHVFQYTIFSATVSMSFLGIAVDELEFFVQVHPWAGKEKEMSILKTGFKMRSSSQNTTARSHAKKTVSALIRSCHDTARTSSGAYPCNSGFRTYGGTCNNAKNAEWGANRKGLKRMDNGKFDPAFLPGTNDFPVEGMPNPRTVSRALFSQDVSKPSARKITMLAVYWGQFTDHDVGITPESSSTVVEERMDIEIEDPHDPLFKRHQGILGFARSRGVTEAFKCCGNGMKERFPRAQINAQTSYIDASHVYGCERDRVDSLRKRKDGKLLTGEIFQKSGQYFLPRNRVEDLGIKLNNAASESDQHFVAGDVRANEQPVLTSLHTIFMREHNRLASLLKKSFPCWKEEKVFQYTRKIVATQIQFITYRYFVPTILGKKHGIPKYDGYKPDVDPSIASIFSTCAFRFGHSMVADTLTILESGHNTHPKSGIRLLDVFFNPSFVKDVGIESILLGASHQIAETVDTKVVDSLQNELFKELTGGTDLVVLNIQRGRDHGVPKYNDARELYGLKRKSTFADITSDTAIQKILYDLYRSVDQLDCFVGGLAEDHTDDSELGELFHTVVRDQFIRLRDGDRFYFEGLNWPKEVSETDPVREIGTGSLRLQDIIVRNSGGDLKMSDFPKNVFEM